MTTLNYNDFYSITGNPAGGASVSIGNDYNQVSTVTFPGASVSAQGTVTLTNGFSSSTATYTGYELPDGSPILAGNANDFYITTNGSYSGGQTFPTTATNLACFAVGTRIMTVLGEIPVENLAPGDLVPTMAGRRVAAIRWVGHTTVDCAGHPRPWDVNPVRVATGAFGAGMPTRDLLLSPDHSVFVDGVLIPVRYLVNDATIVQEPVGEITYWHIELDSHDVVLAEGMMTESYLDTGNRGAFVNAGANNPHPDFRLADREIWDKQACATLVESGPVLDAIRQKLAIRAAELGTPLMAAHRVDLVGPGRTEVTIPAGTTRIELVSPCLVPVGESRRLGACIGDIVLDDAKLALDAPALVAGFHAVEYTDGQIWRWTNGEALLEVAGEDHARVLAVDVRFCVAPTAPSRAIAAAA